MKIEELTDQDVLNFLMTSDFEGDYSPTELKYLLVKSRYFYRLSQGRREQLKQESKGIIESLEKDIDLLKYNISELNKSNQVLNDEIYQMKNRKLSFMERLTGQIITKKIKELKDAN